MKYTYHIWLSFFFLVLLLFFNCVKGVTEKTTIIFAPIRQHDGRPAYKAQVLIYKNMDSMLKYARKEIKDSTVIKNSKYYAVTDTLGIAKIVDTFGDLFESKIYYYYIYSDYHGFMFENFSNASPYASDSTQYSLPIPLTLNSVSRLGPYLYEKK